MTLKTLLQAYKTQELLLDMNMDNIEYAKFNHEIRRNHRNMQEHIKKAIKFLENQIEIEEQADKYNL